MNAREREQYLREYSILKNQGKPFFPYAIMKDSTMAAITIGVIVLMSILFGAELGPSLTDIGTRLGKDAIARTLINPTPPMPSFRTLQEDKPEQFEKLVEYVASLKGQN